MEVEKWKKKEDDSTRTGRKPQGTGSLFRILIVIVICKKVADNCRIRKKEHHCEVPTLKKEHWHKDRKTYFKENEDRNKTSKKEKKTKK